MKKLISWVMMISAVLLLSGCFNQPSCGCGGCYKKGYKPVNIKAYQPYYYQTPSCCSQGY